MTCTHVPCGHPEDPKLERHCVCRTCDNYIRRCGEHRHLTGG